MVKNMNDSIKGEKRFSVLLLALLVSIMGLLSGCEQNPMSSHAPSLTPTTPSPATPSIYVLNSAGQLKAFRREDGKLLWQRSEMRCCDGVLTVVNHVAYVVQSNETSSVVTAFDATNGSSLWQVHI